MGDFSRVHAMPNSGQEVPDDFDARLVVLGTEETYSKEPNSAAMAAAKAILESRGSTPRLYRNTLVFLAPDKTRLQDLDEAARKYLAWDSILAEKVELDLSPHQVKQAETQKTAADGAVTARLPETYQWLIVPAQATPKDAVEWQALRLTGQDALAVRASKKLRRDEELLARFAGTRLRMELDRVPLWRDDHVEIKQIVDDFARYTYLPRLRATQVLLEAVQEGVGLLSWEQEGFAFADSYDEDAGRYRGLRRGQTMAITDADGQGLLVKPDVARKQIDEETVGPPPDKETDNGTDRPDDKEPDPPPPPPPPPQPKRFHGTATLDAARAGRDASQIADEVIAHLTGLVGAKVTVTLEIEAEIPAGAPENVVRTVTENSRTLKFTSQGFEKE